MDLNMLQQAVTDAELETKAVILLYDLSHIGCITLNYKQSIADLVFNWKPGIELIVFFNIPEAIRILTESFAAVIPDTIPVLKAGSYDEALLAARAHKAGSATVLNGESNLTNEDAAAKNEFLAVVARISWMNMLDQHITIPLHDNRDHSYFKALEALQSDLRAKEKEKNRELDQLTANLEQRITHMVIKMNAQTEMNRQTGRDSEKEIAELKSRIASQDIELTRVSTAIAEKTTALRNLLDQIYALEIDPTQKRLMTDACLSLIETETIEKRLNIELTESDSVFLSKLQKKHPNLNQRELRISLLVKLNYDTREIARSVGISTRGMESIRYRMHKKLSLGKHQSIKTYLSDLAVTM
ncbi:MAG: transcriptional regulator [Candidatus Chlorobium antarcticum]|nr:transcriptional regulator [Candidatus Chlorobium antarcticum]